MKLTIQFTIKFTIQIGACMGMRVRGVGWGVNSWGESICHKSFFTPTPPSLAGGAGSSRNAKGKKQKHIHKKYKTNSRFVFENHENSLCGPVKVSFTKLKTMPLQPNSGMCCLAGQVVHKPEH